MLRYHRVLPFIPSHEKQHPASRRCSLLPLESQCTWETNSNCHGKRRKNMAKYCILEHDDYRYLKLYKYVITPCSNNPMSVLIDTSNFNGLTDGLDGVKPQSLRIPWSYYASLYVFELRKKTNDEACNIHICMDYSNSPALKLAAAILSPILNIMPLTSQGLLSFTGIHDIPRHVISVNPLILTQCNPKPPLQAHCSQ